MIGETLKRIRNIYGLKAKEMSEKLEISASYLSEIENGKKQPSLELLNKYAEVFGMKLSSLILLSENLEDANKKQEGGTFIKNLMLKVINSMSDDLTDAAYEES